MYLSLYCFSPENCEEMFYVLLLCLLILIVFFSESYSWRVAKKSFGGTRNVVLPYNFNKFQLLHHSFRALARKWKLITFSQNWDYDVYQRSPPWLATRKKKLLHHIGFWKTTSWETNISEHDIIQHTEIMTEKCFFLCLS